MASDARLSTGLPQHPKTVKLIRRLQERGSWALVCLFLWVADNRPDGNLAGMSDEDVEIAASWAGETGAFVSALAEVGFLDGEAGARTVHQWSEHNPWAASRGQRIECAKRAAAVRWERREDAVGMRSASAAHADRMRSAQKRNALHPTQPNPTQPNRKDKSTAPPSAAPRSRGTRIPESFAVTEAHREFARSKDLPSPDEHIGEFIDYWLAKPGAGGLKLDWDATFRIWLRRARQMKSGGNGSNGLTKAEVIQQHNLAACEQAKASFRKPSNGEPLPILRGAQ